MAQNVDPEDEVKRLQRCMSDLVSVLALPSVLSASDSVQIPEAFLDALVELLDLDFAYAHAWMAAEQAPFELLRRADLRWCSEQEIRRDVHRWMAEEVADDPPVMRRLIGDREVSLLSLPLGLAGRLGVIVVGCERWDFPQEAERVVASVATNQLAVMLQHTQLLTEQKRVARELDLRVAQKTRELAAANARLKHTEAQSRLIIDNIPGLVALMSGSGEIDVVNRQFLEYFGQTLEQLRSSGTNGTVHPEDVPRAADVFSKSIAAGTPYEIPQRFKRSDGVYRWFQHRGYPLRDPDGTIVRWCVLLTDIDDQKRAERAVLASESNLRLIIDTMPVLAWSALPDGRADFFNQRWLSYTGLSPAKAQEWGWIEVVHPEDLERMSAYWQSLIRRGAPGEIEARFRRLDGTYRWFLFRTNPLRDESGAIVKWYGTNTDIEDRKLVEEELRRKDEFLSKAQRLSLSGSFSWCVDTNEVRFSEGARRIYGFDLDTPVTMEMIVDRTHPDDVAILEGEIIGAHGTAGDQNYSIRLQMPDGSIKYLRGSAQETRDNCGRREFVGAIQDVTARHIAEQALEKARTELAHVSRATSLSALTASIAHEINQPLSGIITNASTCLRMLNADPPNLEGARETAKRTIRDGNRGSDVITRLRTLFSRKEVLAERVDLNEATREVIALLTSEIQRNGAILRQEFAHRLPIVEGDRIQLQQVILNLVRNASDAMNGIDDRPKWLTIRTQYVDDCVCVSVQDSGVGFDPASAERLFESFYTTKADGMGIGLWVSRSIVEAHGGRMWAAPNDGPGATFAFSIPCHLPPPVKQVATQWPLQSTR